MSAKIAARTPNVAPSPAQDCTQDAATFTLADGTSLTAHVRRSARARQARLSLGQSGGLRLVVPQQWPAHMVRQALPRFLPWLERAWQRHQRHAPKAELPPAITLPLPGLTFLVESAGDLAQGRKQIQSGAQPLLISQQAQCLLLLETPGRLRLFGPTEDAALCALALRQWCRNKAARLLPPYLLHLAAQEGFALMSASVRDQRSRWGSCSRVRPGAQKQPAARPRAGLRSFLNSLWGEHVAAPGSTDGADSASGATGMDAAGRISLNWRALLLPMPLLEHLCWHELCHLRQMNHSPAYHAELAHFSPHWPEMEKALTRAWRELPWWTLHDGRE